MAALLPSASLPDDEPYVEAAHEALVLVWEPIQRWRMESREAIILQRTLCEAARQRRRDAGGLWDGDERRRRARSLLNRDPFWLSLPEVRFLRASERRAQKRRFAIAGLTLAVLGGAVLGGYATFMARGAQRARAAQELAGVALAVGDRPAGLPASLLLALRSLEESPTSEGWRAFANAVAFSPPLIGRFHNPSPPLGLVAAPNGARLALSGKDGQITLLDGDLRQTGQIAAGKPVRRLFFSPGGHYLAGIAENDSEFTVWSLPEGRPVFRFPDESTFVESLAFSPDERSLAVGLLGGEEGKPVRVYDLRRPDAPPRAFELKGRAVYVRFDRTGRTLFAAGRDSARIWTGWNAQTPPKPQEIAWRTKTSEASADEDLRRLVIAGLGTESPTGAWSLRSGTPETSSVDLGVAEYVAMAPDGSAAAVSRWDDAGSRAELTVYRENRQENGTTWDEGDTLRLPSHLSNLAFSPTGREIVATSEDGAVFIDSLSVDRLDRARLRPIARLAHERPTLNAACFRSANSGTLRVATVSVEGEVRLWQLDHLVRPDRIRLEDGEPWIAFDERGRLVEGGSSLRAWSLDETPAPPAKTDAASVAWPLDSPLRLTTATRRAAQPGGNAEAWAVGRDHFAVLAAGTLTVWDRRQGRIVGQGPASRTSSIAIGDSDQGTVCVGLGSGSESMRAWRLDAARRRLTSLRWPDAPVSDAVVRFFGSGDRFATATAVGRIEIWRTTSNGVAAEAAFQLASRPIALALAPDARTLAWSGADRRTRVIRLADLAEIASYDSDLYSRNLEFTPDGRYLAAVEAFEGETIARPVSVRLWPLPMNGEARSRLAQPRIVRNLTQDEWRAYAPSLPFRKIDPR